MNEIMRNKIVVITGGTKGLGFAMAEALGRAGATIYLCSRSANSVEGAVARLRAGAG